MMKKYFYLIIIAVLSAMPVFLTSCGGDDDEPDSMIIGKWELTKSILNMSIWDAENEKWVDDVSTENGEGETFEFTANKLFITDPSYPGNNKTLDYHFNPTTNTLYVFQFADYKVEKLTSKELVLVQTEEMPFYKTTLTIEFVRI